MMVTSLTSAVAFLSCFISPIMPIKSYSIFATITVLICFGMTIVLQPINYYIYERYILCVKTQVDPPIEDTTELYREKSRSVLFSRLSPIIHKLRVVIVIVGVTICFVNIRSMTLIQTESENASILKESNPLELVLQWQNKELWRRNVLSIDLVYGLKAYL
jgi:predicted RND superfamily exporter protein